jgi:hypothetical protein
MAAVAHNPGSAAKVGISQKVGRDFNQADKAKHETVRQSIDKARAEVKARHG